MRITKQIAAWFGLAMLFAGSVGFALSQTISAPVEAIVAAHRHADGRIEVAIEQDGVLVLPESRFLPADAETGRWLRSSPVNLAVTVPEPEPVVTERLVEVPVEVQVPVEGLVLRLSVLPSDHEAYVCLEQEDEDGNTVVWTDDEGETTGYGTAHSIYESGVLRGWSTVIRLLGFPQEHFEERQLLAAWYLQCASYHGIDHRPEEEWADDPDDWMK